MAKGMKGTYFHNIDSKGRIIIPVKFREVLGLEYTIAPGYDGNLVLYPNDEWEKLMDKVDEMGDETLELRNFQRFIYPQADDCEIDNQGRSLIPARLREKFGLGKEVVISGRGKVAEIWSIEGWNKLTDMGVFEPETATKTLSDYRKEKMNSKSVND